MGVPSKETREVPVEDYMEIRYMQGTTACEMPGCNKLEPPGEEVVQNGVVMCVECALKWDRWACRRVIQMVKGVEP